MTQTKPRLKKKIPEKIDLYNLVFLIPFDVTSTIELAKKINEIIDYLESLKKVSKENI